MERSIKLLFITSILQCDGVTLRRQLEHIVQGRRDSTEFYQRVDDDFMPLQTRRDRNRFYQGIEDFMTSRRSFYKYDPRELSTVLGVPSRPSHLPEAEPILPGHTLIRPSLGMLKSSVKFPHKDWDEGAGVYGSYDNLGETFGRNERLLYSGFRRSPSDYIMVLPKKKVYTKPSFKLVPIVLDLNKKERAKNEVQRIFQGLNMPTLKGKMKLIYVILNGNNLQPILNKPPNENSYYLNGDRYSNFKPNYKVSQNNVYNYASKLLRTKENDIKSDSENLDKIGAKNEIKALSSLGEDLETKENNKLSLFLDTQDNFNHIKINVDAPDISELVPQDPKTLQNLRQWWFYNQDDYTPFRDYAATEKYS